MSILNRFSAAFNSQPKNLNELKKEENTIGQFLSSEEKTKILGGKRPTQENATGISVLPPL